MPRPRSARAFVLAPLLAAAAAGCSAPGSTPPPHVTGGNGDGGGQVVQTGPLSLPFVVSDDFVPSGFMGDSPVDFGGIKMSSDSTKCIARSPGAKGACYTIAWTPTLLTGAKSAWVGVYWQYPSDNWGAKEGKPIVAGAQTVTFMAVGAAGGEQIEFLAGGVNVSGGTPGLTYADTFTAHTDVTLTTTWAPYQISLTGDAYSSVIGAFAWTITTSSATPVTFYVDNIEWN